MAEIRYAEAADRDPWFRLDRHLSEEEFLRKVRDRRGYLLTEGGRPAGLLRYNLFWDNTPFCTLLMVEASCRGRGFGTRLMDRWEAEMKAMGYAAVLTSTQADESASTSTGSGGTRTAAVSSGRSRGRSSLRSCSW